MVWHFPSSHVWRTTATMYSCIYETLAHGNPVVSQPIWNTPIPSHILRHPTMSSTSDEDEKYERRAAKKARKADLASDLQAAHEFSSSRTQTPEPSEVDDDDDPATGSDEDPNWRANLASDLKYTGSSPKESEESSEESDTDEDDAKEEEEGKEEAKNQLP